jgi:agarase
MKIRNVLMLTLCVFTRLSLAGSVYASDGGKPWTKWQTKTIKPARTIDKVNEFGGSQKHKLKATGFFYVTENSNKWWMVDPDGHLFFMTGLNGTSLRGSVM